MANYFFKVSEILRSMLFYKEMRIRKVYIGLLLDYILFVSWLLLLTIETNQLRKCVWRGFLRRGVGRGFCILGGVISEQSIVLIFFVAFELVLGR